jgi:8-oxo-dGTP pyrophosphatase MutT (NUDIX family)
MSFIENILPYKITDFSAFVPVLVVGQEIGYTKPDFAKTISDFDNTWNLTSNGLELSAEFETFDDRSAAVDKTFLGLTAAGLLAAEPDYSAFGGTDWYPVRYRQNAVPLFKVRRFYTVYIGIQNNAVFLNGYHNGEYWLAVRSSNVHEDPDMLDVITGGSTRYGESTYETLIHEAHDEAGLDPEDLVRAIPCGSLYVRWINPEGFLRHEHFHLFDIDLKDKVPQTRLPIEVVGFKKYSFEELFTLVETGKQIKPHMNLVITDFMLRHGLLKNDYTGFNILNEILYRPTE